MKFTKKMKKKGLALRNIRWKNFTMQKVLMI